MVFFCFMVDQTRTTKSTKPAAGMCGRCGSGARVAEMQTATRVFYVPVHHKSWRAIVCSGCGSILKSYSRSIRRR
ncbi:uncharacterized protein LOC144700898 [Wolffia australiana]